MKKFLITFALVLAFNSETMAQTESEDAQLVSLGAVNLVGGAVLLGIQGKFNIKSNVLTGIGSLMMGSGGLILMTYYYPLFSRNWSGGDIGDVGVILGYGVSVTLIGAGVYCFVKDCNGLKNNSSKNNALNYLQLGILPNAGYAGFKYGF